MATKPRCLSLVLPLALCACGSSSSGPVPPPQVTTTIPASGATNVHVSIVVRAVFAIDMDASSFTPETFTLESATGRVVASVSYDSSTRTASLTPAVPLTKQASYKASLTTQIRDAQGRALSAPHIWSFSTLASSWTAPEILGDGDALALVADAKGAAHVLYGGQGRAALYARADANGTWGARETLPVAQVSSASLAADSSGNVIAALVDSNGNLLVTRRTGASTWTSPENVQSGGVTSGPDVAMADNGQILVAWNQGDDAFARGFTVANSWTAVRTLGKTMPRVWLASSGGGYVVYAYLRREGQFQNYKYSIQQVRECVDAAGAWSTCDPGQGNGTILPITRLEAAIAPSGNMMLGVEWRGFNGIEGFQSVTTLRRVGSKWSPGGFASGRFDDQPAYRMRLGGTFGDTRILAYRGSPQHPTGRGVVVAIGDIGTGSWTRSESISRDTQIDAFAVTVSLGGRSIAAWDDGGIVVRDYDSATGWGQQVSLSQHAGAASGVRIVSHADGRTTLIWTADGKATAAHEL